MGYGWVGLVRMEWCFRSGLDDGVEGWARFFIRICACPIAVDNQASTLLRFASGSHGVDEVDGSTTVDEGVTMPGLSHRGHEARVSPCRLMDCEMVLGAAEDGSCDIMHFALRRSTYVNAGSSHSMAVHREAMLH